MRKLIYAILSCFFGGYILFVGTTPTTVTDTTTKTDAIVVLTGAPGRIACAVDLLDKGYAGQLLISGVSPQENLTNLLKSQKCDDKIISMTPALSTIDMGVRARTTVGNAVETEKWIQDRKIKSIRLVTSALHMRRSLLEFKRIAPDLVVIPHPVNIIFWRSFIDTPKLIKKSILEYTKYLMALVHFQRIFRQNLSS